LIDENIINNRDARDSYRMQVAFIRELCMCHLLP